MESAMRFKTHIQLTDFNINANSISPTNITMESSKFICVHEKVNEKSQLSIIDICSTPTVIRINCEFGIDSAILNPSGKYIALRSAQTIQIYERGNQAPIKEYSITEEVFLKWISLTMLAIVTTTSVYHWSIEGDSTPQNIFDRHERLFECQIFNYRTDINQQLLLLIGITSMHYGFMQLYSVKRKITRTYDGHVAAFATFKMEMNTEPSTLLCFAVGSGQGSKLRVIEVETPATGNTPFTEKAVDVALQGSTDFPVAMQVSAKYDVIYLITKCIHMYDIESGTCIFKSHILADTILVTAPNDTSGGILCVDSKGLVISITVDETQIVPHITNVLHNTDLAIRMSVRNNLWCNENVFVQRFHVLFENAQYAEAAKLAAISPNGILKTKDTIQKFEKVQSSIFPTPLLLYLNNMLNMNNDLDEQHTLKLFEILYSHGEVLFRNNKLAFCKPVITLIAKFSSNLIQQFGIREGIPYTLLENFQSCVDNLLKEKEEGGHLSTESSTKRTRGCTCHNTVSKKPKSGEDDNNSSVSSTTSDDVTETTIQNVKNALRHSESATLCKAINAMVKVHNQKRE